MELFGGFDAFCDRVQPQHIAQRNNRFGNGLVFGVLPHVADESAVNFEGIYRQPVEIAEGRIAGTKVIDTNVNALTLYLGEQLVRHAKVLYQHAFGNFQGKGIGRQATVLQNLV